MSDLEKVLVMIIIALIAQAFYFVWLINIVSILADHVALLTYEVNE